MVSKFEFMDGWNYIENRGNFYVVSISCDFRNYCGGIGSSLAEDIAIELATTKYKIRLKDQLSS